LRQEKPFELLEQFAREKLPAAYSRCITMPFGNSQPKQSSAHWRIPKITRRSKPLSPLIAKLNRRAERLPGTYRAQNSAPI
jgi:hypothetical protein